MITDLITAYCKSKKKNIREYAVLISKIISVDRKVILHNKKRTEEVLEKVIDIYFERYLLARDANYDISELFIKNPYIKTFKLSKEVNAILEYFMRNKMVFDIEKNELNIILLAVIIKMANDLDILVNSFNNEKTNFNNIILKYIDTYHKIDFIFLIDQGKKNTKALIELVKNNAKCEKKLFEQLNNPNSFNRYIGIDEEARYYIAQYNHYIEQLDEYDVAIAKKIYNLKNIDDKFVFISTEIAGITLIKEIAIRKKASTFFIPVKKKFLMKDKNIKDIIKLFESKILAKYLKLLINHNECTKELTDILDKNKIDYYIYCNTTFDVNQIDYNYKYLFNKELINQIPEGYNKKSNILLETLNMVIEDNKLLALSEENI